MTTLLSQNLDDQATSGDPEMAEDSLDLPEGDLDEAPTSPESASAAIDRSVWRIVVALDASRYSQAVLEKATHLAALLHSEILGLFVEDINLLRLAELPFVREVRFSEVEGRQLESAELQRGLRARAAILRRELEVAAQRRHLRSTFRVTRGPVNAELLAAALETDILVLGRLGHSVARRVRLGSAARTVIAKAASAVLLVRDSVDADEAVIVIFDNSAASHRALRIAIDLAERVGELRVLIAAEGDEPAYQMRQMCVQMVGDRGPHVQYRHFPQLTPDVVLQLVREQTGGLLVLGISETGLPPEVIQLLVEDAPQHILVIR